MDCNTSRFMYRFWLFHADLIWIAISYMHIYHETMCCQSPNILPVLTVWFLFWIISTTWIIYVPSLDLCLWYQLNCAWFLLSSHHSLWHIYASFSSNLISIHGCSDIHSLLPSYMPYIHAYMAGLHLLWSISMYVWLKFHSIWHQLCWLGYAGDLIPINA